MSVAAGCGLWSRILIFYYEDCLHMLLFFFLPYVALLTEDGKVRDMFVYARLLIREAQRHDGLADFTIAWLWVLRGNTFG